MLLNKRVHRKIAEVEEEDNEESLKLNGQKRECNNYFLQTYKKTCFEEKYKRESLYASVETLLKYFVL